jgi:hypothetical protein
MPSKKPATRVKKTVRAKKPSPVTKVLGPRLTVVAVICVLATGMLYAARQQSRPTEMTPASMRSAAFAATSASTANAVDAPTAPVVSSTDASAVAKAPAVTITGCLERANDAFRLKDTVGAEVPKARSWKSGFLKKGSASIAVVDPAHAYKLANFVGRRVSVTGTLVDREMQVRSLRRVATSCETRPSL